MVPQWINWTLHSNTSDRLCRAKCMSPPAFPCSVVPRGCVRTATLAGASMDSWFAMGTGGATMPVFAVSTPLVIVHESPHADGGSGGGAGGGRCLPRNAGAAACNESLGLAPLAIQRPIVAWQLPLLMAPSLFHALAHFLAPLISSRARSNVVWASLANLLAYNRTQHVRHRPRL